MKTERLLTNIYGLLFIFTLIVFNFKPIQAQTCEDFLNLNTTIVYDHFNPRHIETYTLGHDTDSISVQNAKLIRVALKEIFPNLEIFVDPNVLPHKMDVRTMVDFFAENVHSINLIFSEYTEGDIIITDSTSIATYSDGDTNSSLQLRFQVFNKFGSALLYPLAKIRPLDRKKLVDQWKMFSTLINGKNQLIIN